MLISLTLLLASNANANEIASAATDFKVPTIKATQLSIQGQDLLNMAGSIADENSLDDFNAHLGSTATWMSQTPMMSYSVVNQLDISAAMDGDSIPVSLTESLSGDVQKYFGSDRGAFVYGGATWDSAKEGEADMTHEASSALGAGYGRIVDARTIAQAAAAFDAIGKQPTAAELTAVAEMIGRRPQFVVNYRFEADKYYYAALSDAMGGLDSTQLFEIRQVLESPLYNVGARRVGWNVGAGTESTYTGIGDGEIQVDDVPLNQFAGYAMLLNPQTGLLFSQELSIANALSDDDIAAELSLSAALNTDHTSSWQTLVDAGITKTLTDDGGNFFLNAASNIAIGGDFVASAGLGIERELLEDAPLTWTLSSNLTYFVY